MLRTHYPFPWLVLASAFIFHSFESLMPPSPIYPRAVGVLSKWETILLKVFQCAEQTHKYNYVFQYLGEKKNWARCFIAAVTVAKNNGRVLTAISVKRKKIHVRHKSIELIPLVTDSDKNKIKKKLKMICRVIMKRILFQKSNLFSIFGSCLWENCVFFFHYTWL